ncbi:hypothetical protein RHSIM_RhsimUnG0152100 [Rhododendron simsii]|uniref:Bulb-type lectin domain-containing protein n=1 Tax=Rhododendron simsii TaxID=118357 RepID=A0A834FU76_RHOSS|nr:hypothetical protein RHSIM_RhsimUnG0152100 [Rhododendron simsii]
MDFSLCFFLILPLFFTPSSSTPPSYISEVGDNAFIYAVWFAKSFDRTVVWTANRDQTVNGKGSKLLLQKGGNLLLSTCSNTSPILWQSFDSPTNTLLPHQLFTRIRNSSDWSYGCKLDQGYYLSAGDDQTVDFVSMGYLELYGYEYDVYKNHTLKSCKEKCLNSAICKGFLFKFEEGVYNCYAKSQLLNGKSSPNLLRTLHVKLNVSVKDNSFKPSVKQIQLNC